MRGAALRLQRLVQEVGRRHPGRDVDLIAHSQGGIIARTYLALIAPRSPIEVPAIDHVITYASPHTGAPGAGAAVALREGTLIGGIFLDAASGLSQAGAPIPDPNSTATAQLAPGSELLGSLAAQDVKWGTQVLALAIPNDVVVPADKALWPEKSSRVVPPKGAWGHEEIVASDAARGIAYDFLRDLPPTCPGGWDLFGPLGGKVIGAAESAVPSAYKAFEGPSVLVKKALSLVGRLL